MSGARRGPNQGIDFFQSAIVAVTETLTIDGISPVKPHCFLGVEFFADAAGATPATPSAGTLAVDVRTFNNPQHYEAVPSNSIDATAPTTVSWAANTTSARVTPSGIVGAAYYRATVSCNES
ncbi:gp71 [Alphaproteobacteria phage PhiJL001]|uniref:Gp71 n=1 Tax=Alphaproteobacteria phage PhiJL001 TaxID=2681607 RepID=Q5DN34_9CAUD|nr:tail protein [Alphaproteobacteria phage PhiJL001]AAT69547.1 gp71 [Alphaproteobacteria phage PhiJL001]